MKQAAMTISDVIHQLSTHDNILILSHRFPDGDTLGSAFALCGALQRLGKHARILCSDEIPEKFLFMKKAIEEEAFEPEYVIAVDVASKALLGSLQDKYGSITDLCIDHHATNEIYAKQTYVDSIAAATCEIIYLIVDLLLSEMPKEIADCLYTGISTDTGCFKFSNVTSTTHRIAAELIDAGCDSSKISKLMFDTKSKSRIAIEHEVIEKLNFLFDGRCAMVTVTKEMIKRTGALESDIDGISSLPRMIEGVLVGVTLRQTDNDSYKISLRTSDEINAAEIAAKFGGGGHAAAAGCNISGNEEDVKGKLADAVKEALDAVKIS